ncbi:MAG: hypothetical protein L6R30_11410 [Thermoanaerobaculia bacterium]|nr:hypothetical protein [Thermoanaerobaculia bacterium]
MSRHATLTLLALLIRASLVLAEGPPADSPAKAPGAAAERKASTVIHDPGAREKLLGEHLLTLQWIGWERPGKATVRIEDGVLLLKGEQRGKENGDFLAIEGRITQVWEKEFRFSGRIETQVSYINGGKPCAREGEVTFRITGKRRYWRLKEMENPCEGGNLVDYVDIFLR